MTVKSALLTRPPHQSVCQALLGGLPFLISLLATTRPMGPAYAQAQDAAPLQVAQNYSPTSVSGNAAILPPSPPPSQNPYLASSCAAGSFRFLAR